MKSQKERREIMRNSKIFQMSRKKIKPEIQEAPRNPRIITTKKIICKYG